VYRTELDDAELAHHRRQPEVGHLADGLAEQRPADGRRHRDVSLLELDRVAEDQIVSLAAAGFLILEHDLRSQTHAVRRDLRRIDRRKLAQALAQMPEARLHELLALERGLVFTVLTEVAELDGFANFLRQRDVELVL